MPAQIERVLNNPAHTSLPKPACYASRDSALELCAVRMPSPPRVPQNPSRKEYIRTENPYVTRQWDLS